MPRRGPRVRIPSRAFFISAKTMRTAKKKGQNVTMCLHRRNILSLFLYRTTVRDRAGACGSEVQFSSSGFRVSKKLYPVVPNHYAVCNRVFNRTRPLDKTAIMLWKSGNRSLFRSVDCRCSRAWCSGCCAPRVHGYNQAEHPKR